MDAIRHGALLSPKRRAPDAARVCRGPGAQSACKTPALLRTAAASKCEELISWPLSQEDPELHIYKKLHARYAERRDQPLSGDAGLEGYCAADGACVPDVDYLRLELEIGLADKVQRAPIFVRRAPTAKRKVSLFAYWKREALAAIDAEIDRNMDIPPAPAAGKAAPEVEKHGQAEHPNAEPPNKVEISVQHEGTEASWRAAADRGEAPTPTSILAIGMLLNSWSALSLNGRTLQEIIRQSDLNHDGMLDMEELRNVLLKNDLKVEERDLADVWKFLTNYSADGDAKVGVEELQRAISLAVDRKNLADWIGDLQIHELISNHLLPSASPSGNGVENPVKYIVDRQPEDVLRQVVSVCLCSCAPVSVCMCVC